MKYHIARGDEKLGEHNDLDVTGGLRRGEFLPTDLCWSAGMPEWEPLSARFEVEPDEPETDPFSTLDGASTALPRPGDFELASRWQRLMATLLDGITVMPAMMLISKALDSEVFAERLQTLPPETWAATYNQHINDTVAAHPERFYLPMAIFIGLGLINATLLTLRGQSIGKWFTGLRIVKFQTGLNPGFISAVLLRSIAISLLYNAPYIGFGILLFDIACIFRPDKRCLHDLIADTMVIRVRRQR